MIRRQTMSLLRIVTLLLVGSVVSQAQSLSPLTRHVRDVTQNGQARSLGRLSPTQTMRLVLVLPLRNEAALDDFLKELYNPSSPSYRHYLTVEEFTARFGPSQEDYDAVIRFAETNGLTVVGTSRNRLNLDVTGTVANIEKAFHLNMRLYMHPTENRTFFAPDREPVARLPFPLWHIAGLENYSLPRPAGLHQRETTGQPNATIGSGPSSSFLGSDMRPAYYGGTALTGAGQSLGLVEYYGTNLVDLNTYLSTAGLTNNVPIRLLSTDGTSTSCIYPLCDDAEQTLDMTQAIGMAPGLSNLVVYIGSSDAAIFNAMATASPLNAQLSSSWTWSPADPSTDDPYFKAFAAQGQNLFQASGDSSAWNPGSTIYPADDPYVTTVGGTDLTTSSAGGSWSSESAWVDGGGGVSPDGYAIPSWQTAAASACSGCSQTFRNGPDVSANANFTFYVCANQSGCTANNYGGTSFAAPMWAGYLALVNQQAVASGGKPVGFINPSLYSIGAGSSYGSDFHDVASGSNGYSATRGYDLATGWGSPNGSGLINALAGGGGSSAPDFSLSASPASATVAQGSSGTSTITSMVTGGFNSNISLSATGQPSGVNVSFNPSSITGAGTSTMTLLVAASTATGTYRITVTGNSGSTTHTTNFSLTVTSTAGQPDFSLSASPASLTVAQGSSGTSAITSTVTGGFNSNISMSATGQPSGVTVSFNPSSITGAGTSTMTLLVASSTATGTYRITVTGNSSGTTHTTSVTLTVTTTGGGGQSNFTINALPTSITLARGTTGSSMITTAISGGFDSSISLSASGAGRRVYITFSPSSTIPAPGSGAAIMNLRVSRYASTGTRTITITGSGGGVTHTTTVTLTINGSGGTTVAPAVR